MNKKKTVVAESEEDTRTTILDADIPAFNSTYKASNERSRISRDGTTLLLPSARNNGLPGRVEIFTKVNGTWTSQYGIQGFNNGANMGVGNDINSDGTIFVTNNRLGNGTKQFEIHELSGGTWARRDQVTHYSSHVSSLAINGAGDIVVLGNEYDGGSPFPGGVRVFEYSGSSWTQTFTASGSGVEALGVSVSLNEVGDVFVAGGMQHSDGVNRVGQIRVFTKQSGTWGQRAALSGPSGYDLSLFGWDVDIDDAGETIVGGGWTYGSSADGILMVFTGSQSTWSMASTIYGQQTGEQLGWRTAISGDGKTVIGRASGNSESGTASTGRGYVITRLGSTFTLTEDVPAQQLGESFGLDDISQDGSVMVGAAALNDETATDAGRYYVFNRVILTPPPTTSYRVYVANETDTIATYDRAFLEDTHSLIRYDNYSYGGSIWNTDIYTDGDGEGKYWELGKSIRSGGGQQPNIFNYWIYFATANSLQPTASTSYVDQGPTGYNHGHNYGLFLHFKLHSVPSDIATDTNHIMHQWMYDTSFAYQLDWVSGTQIVVKGKTSGSSFTNYSNNITISPTVYNKMCMVVNKFSGEERIAFFLNGVKQFDSSDSSAGVGHASSLGTAVTDLLTGYRTGSSSEQYLYVLRDIASAAWDTPAKMKDLRFFNQVLTDAQAISLTL